MQSPRKHSGASLLEITLALAVLAIGLLGSYAIHCNTLKNVKRADGAAVAAKNLVQRLDQIRGYGWSYLAVPSNIANLLTTPIDATVAALPELTSEQITVTPLISGTLSMPAGASTPPAIVTTGSFSVTRNGTATPVITGSAGTMKDQLTVKVVAGMTWKDPSGQHSREMSAIISPAAMGK